MRTLLLLITLIVAPSALAKENTYEVLSWDDLMPAGEWDRYDKQLEAYFKSPIEEGSVQDQAIQFGTFNVVSELDGLKVSLPGFVLPFEYARGQYITEFLLVPYFGACLHTPPPPPNQIVYVKTDKPVRFDSLWAPIWANGTMRTEKNLNGLGDAAYTLHLEAWKPYRSSDEN